MNSRSLKISFVLTLFFFGILPIFSDSWSNQLSEPLTISAANTKCKEMGGGMRLPSKADFEKALASGVVKGWKLSKTLSSVYWTSTPDSSNKNFTFDANKGTFASNRNDMTMFIRCYSPK
ncbi:MAG: hypothetical protein H7A24_17230 [Leptospiraceae bacterium]|nr:hypothetical protein [Leptospiraceae bacterium]